MRPKYLARTVRRQRGRLAVAALALVPALLVLTPFGSPKGYTGVAGGAVALFAVLAVLALRRDHRAALAEAAEPVAATSQPGTEQSAAEGPEPIPAKGRRALKRWETRLNHGWSATATAELLGSVHRKRTHPDYRLRALELLCDHEAAVRRERRPTRSFDVDIAIVSTMNLLGGTTSANEAEILAYRAAGLKVALVHHPVLDRALERPIHPRLRDLVDDEQIFEAGPGDTVRCDLAIVRFPTALASLMDDRPTIESKRTVLLVNQTPYEEYGIAGGYGTPWSIRDVHRNVTTWLGEHTWYAIGPAVRDVLHTHHAEEMQGIDLATDFWYETIDVANWTPEEPRVRTAGEPIRLGRHSRDNITKFPNMAKRLREAYPAAEDLEIHVLGGTKALTQILGSVPPRWTAHPFGAVSPVEFLGSIDVYAYYIDENYIEAFGRSPLEAMAAGVPCILPWSFAELFGDGALYCEPEEVDANVRRLAADPELRDERIAAGMRVIAERFSQAALVRRVGGLGVAVDPVRLRRLEIDSALTLEGTR